MSDQNEKAPAPSTAIDDVEVEMPDELLEGVAGGGGTSMCSMMMCSTMEDSAQEKPQG